MSNLSVPTNLRPIVDKFGMSIHDCPAAIPLSWARVAMLRLSGAEPNDGVVPYTLYDAAYLYQRALAMTPLCAECRAEAEAGFAAILDSMDTDEAV